MSRSKLTLCCLLGGLLISLIPRTAPAVEVIDPSDPDILYTGRWDDSTASAPWAQAKGSSLIVRFEGTSLAVSMTTDSQEYFRVILDGDAGASSKQLIPSGSPVLLASGLSDAVHQLELVKETDRDRATLTSIELDDGRFLAGAPARPTRRIVFYGDSNLAGYSLESERNEGDVDLQGAYYTYAGITARMFGAEHHNVSKSGATVSSLNASYDRIDWDSNGLFWNFSLFPADVVVVNIGANDSWRPKNVVKSRYHDLLDDLRTDHPLAHIVLYNAYGWDDTEPANYTHEVVAERSDPNLSSEVFPWVFEQFHGCETDHAGMAQALAAYLQAVLGWSTSPADVPSGYGLNGNVANGGFEEIAPFGGWGWRYFDDAGVSRVDDASGAHQGDHYLSLSNGASARQANPASDGESIDVSVWMRGAFNGDEVDISIEFQDQESGAEIATPLQSETETKSLTTDWALYTMSSTAPSPAGNPVYAARVIFQAAPGDTVHVDSVMIPEPSEWLLLVSGGVWLSLLNRHRLQGGRAAGRRSAG